MVSMRHRAEMDGNFRNLRAAKTEVIGIDHVYITVSQMERSEEFYDRVLRILDFRKNGFSINGERHVQYFNRHFGYVLRPAKLATGHDCYSPGLHHVLLSR
jgi:hypothetical protein